MSEAWESRRQHQMRRRIERACEQFEAAWRDGEAVPIEQFCQQQANPELAAALLPELVGVELDLRRERGEEPSSEEYCQRFPEHAQSVRQVFREADESLAASSESRSLGLHRGAISTSEPPDARGVPGYEVIEELGRGGMGVVYKVRDLKLRRLAALKLILHGVHSTQAHRRRFELEAVTVAQLQHPGIVQVYDVGEFDSHPYLVLELVEGGGLSEYTREQPQSVRWSALMVKRLAQAVHYAHERGIIHRDLKPANILLHFNSPGPHTPGGDRTQSTRSSADTMLQDEEVPQPKITDFGLAKHLNVDDLHTKTGVLMGTPSYMSPEQASGRASHVSPASDVYSLGAILYELLAGRPPFHGATYWDTLRMVRDDDPPPPHRLRPRLPRDLETICLKCLEKDPHRRYHSAHVLAEELDRFLNGRPILARPSGFLERTVKWTRRRPAVAALILVALLGITGVVWQWGDALRARGVAEQKAEEAMLARIAEFKQRVEVEQQALRAEEHARRAERSAAEAARQRDAARRQLRIATGRGLAAHSMAQQQLNPPLSLLLAREAVAISRDAGEPIMPLAHEALIASLASAGGTPLPNQGQSIDALLASCDGRWMISSAWVQPLRLWRLGKEKSFPSIALLDEPGLANRMSLSSDGRWLAVTANLGKKVYLARLPAEGLQALWDLGENALADYESCFQLPVASRVLELHFRPDSRWLATRSDEGEVRIWDLTAEDPAAAEILVGNPLSATQMAFSPDNRLMATYSMSTIRLWDLSAEPGPSLQAEWSQSPGHFRELSFSPNGRLLAASHQDSTVRIWEVAGDSSKPGLVIHDRHQACLHLAFSPDSRWLASGSDQRTIKAWDLAAEEPAQRPRFLLGHTGPIVKLVFHPRESRLASISAQDRNVCVWDLASDQDLLFATLLKGHAAGLKDVIFTSEGQLFSGDEVGYIRRWVGPDLQHGRLTTVVKAHNDLIEVHGVAFSRDGRIASSSQDHSVKLWDASSPGKLDLLQTFPVQALGVAFSLDGKRLAAGGRSGTCYTWDLTAEDLAASQIELPGHSGGVLAVAFSPDGRWLASAGDDGTIRLWDLTAGETAAGGKVLPVQEGREVWDLAFAPDGKALVSGHSDGRVRLWNLASEDPSRSPTVLAHRGILRTVGISPDGRWIAAGSRNTTVRLWDLSSEDPEETAVILEGHVRRVLDLDFSHDGRWLATSSLDKTVRFWDLTAEDPRTAVIVLPSDGAPVAGIAFSFCDNYLAAGSDYGEIRMWMLDVDSLIAEARRIAGRDLTPEERARYISPGRPDSQKDSAVP